jgi:Ca-activated chloride channel family protein
MDWKAFGVESSKGAEREAHVLVIAEASEAEVRAPVMVNLVLDRSGSMKGAPLSAAVEAASQFVELARPDDYLGLVLFDGVAEQRVTVMAMDAKGKRAMTEALQGIQTGRGTALYQAVDLAAKGLQRILVPGRRPRLLLLTDGEPSVGPDSQDAFDELGLRLSRDNISVHALGLARHYVAEILAALTQPSGNAFEHVDGPEGLSEAMGAVMSHLFGQVATDALVRLQPQGFNAIACRHGYPAKLDVDAIEVSLGDVSRGLARRVLFTGQLGAGSWNALLHGSSRERGDVRSQKIELEQVSADSPKGKLVLGINHELELVAAETASWLSLARKDLERAEQLLEEAEEHQRKLVALAPEGIVMRRHLERLADLRLAVERGEGDIPLLIRRAQSARAGTSVSQVIPLQVFRPRKPA